jgi:hypothetical protein
MSRAKSLQQRRQMLMAECALQRTTLTAQTRQLGLNTGWIKSGDNLLGRLKNMPAWVSVILAAAVIFIPGRAARLARSGLMLWQFWRNLKTSDSAQS